jgi:hypothetical protein
MNSHFSVGRLDDEKNQLYRILRLEVIVREDDTPKVREAFSEGLDVYTLESRCRVASR